MFVKRTVFSMLLAVVFASATMSSCEAGSWWTYGATASTSNSGGRFYVSVYGIDPITDMEVQLETRQFDRVLPGLPDTPYPGMTLYYHHLPFYTLPASGNYAAVYGYLLYQVNGTIEVVPGAQIMYYESP